MDKSVGLLIDSHIAVRAWADSGNLKSLSDTLGSKLKVFVTNTKYIDDIKKNLVDVDYQYIYQMKIKATPKIWPLLHVAILIRNRHKSISFQSRLNRFLFGFCMKDYSVYNIIKILVKNYRISLLYIPLINSLLELLANALFKKMNIFKFPPDLSNLNYFIFSSSTFEWYTNPLIVYLKKLNIKSVMCVDNWDNISSKTVLFFSPDHVAVLGESSKNAAIRIQGFKSENVIAIGTPRFDEYIQSINYRSTESSLSEKRILYLGASLPHAEKLLLVNLSEKYRDYFKSKNITLFYRPHPYQMPRCRDLTDEDVILNGVKIVTSEDRFDSGVVGEQGYPKMKGVYFNMFDSYSIVISAPTTAALESLLMKKPTIVDASNDGIHNSTAGLSIETYDHLKDLKEINNLFIARNIDDIFLQIKKFIDEEILQIEYDYSNIVYLDHKQYVHRLLSYLNN